MANELTPLESAARALQSAVNRALGITLDWEELAERKKASYRDQARLVLKAIREPSEEMKRAAVLSTIDVWDEERDAAREFATEFAAAIDAALEEGS